MSERIPRDVRANAVRAFPDFTFLDEQAPQGQNSFCHNFLISDTDNNKYLLKAIRLSKVEANNPEIAITEVEASQAVKSPYFAQLKESRRSEGSVYLLLEYLEGRNLKQYIEEKETAFTEREIKEIGINILRGLSDLTRAGIRHQDIKPENIFITAAGEVKILDFGSARFRQPSFKGSTNTNRLHSAPEQIYASKPGALELLKLTCDERSDVYSVGSLLYLLASGSSPFASNKQKLEHELPSPIERDDVSDGLKRIISRMLNPKIRTRPNATTAISFLTSGDVEQIQYERGSFYYQASTSLEKLHTVMELDAEAFDGVVVDASKLPKKEILFIQNGPLNIVIDPQTYLLQKPNEELSKKFKNLPYIELAKSGDNYNTEHITDRDAFVRAVLKYQMESGADYLMPPFFHIREINEDMWVFDADVTTRALEICSSDHLQLPILKGVAVSEAILGSEVTRGRLLDHLTNTDWSQKISGYYVLLENANGEGLPNAAWLSAAREFVTDLLATGKVVIWGHSQLPAIFYSHSGVSLCMGESGSQRKFDISSSSVITGPRTPSPHMYIPALFARMKWTSGMEMFNTHARGNSRDFYCNDQCCTGIDFTNPEEREMDDLAVHFIYQLSKQFKRYSSTGGSRIEKSDLQKALGLYDIFRNSDNELLKKGFTSEIKPPNKTTLQACLEAFHSS